MSNELNFGSLDLVQIPVTIGDRTFILREASSENFCKYLDDRIACSVFDESGKRTGFKDLSKISMLLLSRCLVETTGGAALPVTYEEVRNWPNKITDKLYNTLKKISEIDQEETKEELVKLKEEVENKLKALGEGSAAKNEHNA